MRTGARWTRGGIRAGLLLAPLLAAGPLLAAEPAAEGCVSGACHASLLGAEHVHPPAESCDSCHESVAEPHTRAGGHTFKLVEEPPELCYTCHDAFGKKAAVHAPVQEGMCTTCHDPHAAQEPKLLVLPRKELCTTCHADQLDFKYLHSPVSAGDCTACHAPHESEVRRLLVREFPAEPYVPYTGVEFALCFGCHARDLLEQPETSAATGFRDGERNLHYLHVNDKKKGRSCILCHEVHAGSSPRLVAQSVPFGQWRLPLRFTKTPTGGSCAPGCHRPQGYDRESPGRKRS